MRWVSGSTTAGRHTFFLKWAPLQNYRCQVANMMQDPSLGPTNIRYHHTQFTHHGNRVHGICATVTTKWAAEPLLTWWNEWPAEPVLTWWWEGELQNHCWHGEMSDLQNKCWQVVRGWATEPLLTQLTEWPAEPLLTWWDKSAVQAFETCCWEGVRDNEALWTKGENSCCHLVHSLSLHWLRYYNYIFNIRFWTFVR